jgi:hypothetical protein
LRWRRWERIDPGSSKRFRALAMNPPSLAVGPTIAAQTKISCGPLSRQRRHALPARQSLPAEQEPAAESRGHSAPVSARRGACRCARVCSVITLGTLSARKQTARQSQAIGAAGKFCDGRTTACGRVLASHFPRSVASQDELPDRFSGIPPNNHFYVAARRRAVLWP